MRILGVDPGEKHCGTVLFEDGTMKWTEELKPYELFNRLRGISNSLDLVVMESFKLYPWVMRDLGFSAMETVQVIGVVKYICDRSGIKVVMQDASIKKPTQARMRGQLRSKNPHCRDAELHVRYWLEMQKLKEKAT